MGATLENIPRYGNIKAKGNNLRTLVTKDLRTCFDSKNKLEGLFLIFYHICRSVRLLYFSFGNNLRTLVTKDLRACFDSRNKLKGLFLIFYHICRSVRLLYFSFECRVRSNCFPNMRSKKKLSQTWAPLV